MLTGMLCLSLVAGCFPDSPPLLDLGLWLRSLSDTSAISCGIGHSLLLGPAWLWAAPSLEAPRCLEPGDPAVHSYPCRSLSRARSLLGLWGWASHATPSASTPHHPDVPLCSGGAGVSQLPQHGLLLQSRLNHAVLLCVTPLPAPSLPHKEVYFKEASEREAAFRVLQSSIPQNILQGRTEGGGLQWLGLFTE